MTSSLRTSQKIQRSKLESSDYLPDQEQADEQVQIILDLLQEHTGPVEAQLSKKTIKYIAKISEALAKININHRSYWKISNLVNSVTIVVYVQLQQYEKVQEPAGLLETGLQYVASKQFQAHLYLVKILLAYKGLLSSSESRVNYFEEFMRIKLKVVKSNKNNFWQAKKILQLLVYQSVAIVQLLARHQYSRVNQLYRKGFQMACLLLGPNHKFVHTLKKIIIVRNRTSRILEQKLPSRSLFLNHAGLAGKKIRTISSFKEGQHDQSRLKSKTIMAGFNVSVSSWSSKMPPARLGAQRQQSAKAVIGKQENGHQIQQNKLKSNKTQTKSTVQTYYKSKANEKQKSHISNNLGGRIISQQSKIKESFQKIEVNQHVNQSQVPNQQTKLNQIELAALTQPQLAALNPHNPDQQCQLI